MRIKIVAVGDLDIKTKSAIKIDWNQFSSDFSTQTTETDQEDIRRDEMEERRQEELFEQSTNNEIWRLTENDVEKISLGAAILGL